MLSEKQIQLVVFDMAGTVVDEGGVVYDTLWQVLTRAGAAMTREAFNHWHGANKVEVVRHFLQGGQAPEADVQRVYRQFEEELLSAYFAPGSPLRAMPGAVDCLGRLRAAGIKVAFDTGYPRAVADRLMAHTGLAAHADASVVSEEVGAGRPFPYMIHHLVKHFGLADVRRVAKVGDTARDMQEGLNAGCGLVIGVLSGADDEATLKGEGAHLVLPGVAQITV